MRRTAAAAAYTNFLTGRLLVEEASLLSYFFRREEGEDPQVTHSSKRTIYSNDYHQCTGSMK